MKLVLVSEMFLCLPFVPVTLFLVLLYSVLYAVSLISGRNLLCRHPAEVWASAVSRVSAFSQHVALYPLTHTVPLVRVLFRGVSCMFDPVQTVVTLSDRAYSGTKKLNLKISNSTHYFLLIVQSGESPCLKFLLRTFCAAWNLQFLCAVVPACDCSKISCFGCRMILIQLLSRLRQQSGRQTHWTACAIGEDCFFLLDYLGELGAGARIESAIVISPKLKEPSTVSSIMKNCSQDGESWPSALPEAVDDISVPVLWLQTNEKESLVPSTFFQQTLHFILLEGLSLTEAARTTVEFALGAQDFLK